MKNRSINIKWEWVFMIVLLLTSAGNYGLNLILGRWLGPEAYAQVATVATLVMMFSFIAVGIQMTVAKFIAPLHVEDDLIAIKQLQEQLRGKTLIGGLLLLVVLCVSVPVMADFLHMESQMTLLFIYLGIPLQWLISVERGILQSTDRFKELSFSYFSEMAIRFIATLIIIFYLQNWFAVEQAVALGFLISFAIILTFLFQSDMMFQFRSNPAFPLKTLYAFFVIILTYELGQVVISNADVLLAKHYLDAETAGLYASLALIGKVVYYGTWTIVMVLFPKVIQRKKKGLSYSSLFNKALGAVVAIGGSIVLGCFMFSDFLIAEIFGTQFSEVAPYLWMYAFATMLFAVSNVFVYYYMSLSRYTPIWLSLIFGSCQVGLVIAFHDNYYQFIIIQVICMSGLLMSVISYHLFIELKSKSYALSNSISLSAK